VKGRIIIIVSFLFAFILVTGAIIYLNMKFKNIFWYDFTPVNQAAIVATQQPTQQNEQTQIQSQKVDSTLIVAAAIDSLARNERVAAKDPVPVIPKKDSVKVDKGKNISPAPQKANEVQVAKTEPPKEAIVQNLTKLVKTDPSYGKWVKDTGKLYESMDAKKAAKIILGYSDNIARDLLFSMRKKKAAEIVAEFKPEIAARIISVN
jgi:flagellar motility protein MotE (MotC chaperone)